MRALLLLACAVFLSAAEDIRLSDGREVRGEIQADGSVIAIYGNVRAPLAMKGATVVSHITADEVKARKPTAGPAPAATWKRPSIGDISGLAHAFVEGREKRPVFLRAVFQFLDLRKVEATAFVPRYDETKGGRSVEMNAADKGKYTEQVRLYNLWIDKLHLAQQEMNAAKWSDDVVEKHRHLLASRFDQEVFGADAMDRDLASATPIFNGFSARVGVLDGVPEGLLK